MAGDAVGSGESFQDDQPEAAPAEPAETTSTPEYADPANDPDHGRVEAGTDSRDDTLSDFEPDDEPASGTVVGQTDEVRTDRSDRESRAEPESRDDDAAQIPRVTEADLDAAEEAALAARREALRQAEEARGGRSDRQHFDLPSDTVQGRSDEHETADDAEPVQDNEQETVAGPEAVPADGEQPATENADDPADDRGVFGDVERAHRDTMDSVERAHQSVRDMVEAANREIDELIRSGQLTDLPEDSPNIEDTDIPDVDWQGPDGNGWEDTDGGPESQGWGEGDQGRPPDWEDWGPDDEQGGGDGSGGDEDGGWDEDVDWDNVPDTVDDYEDIPYMTNEQVDARTQESLVRNNDKVSQHEPIRATDYSQEIRPLDEMPQGGAAHMGPTKMHVLRPDSAQQYATDWNAHIERQLASKYDHRYAQDNRPISSQGLKDLAKATLGQEFDGRHYFQEALPAVANGRCDPDQLRTVLNELHPELRHQYGMYQPGQWRDLPYVKDTPLGPVPSRQVEQARQAIAGYVKSLPDGHRYDATRRTPVNTGAMRLRAEIDLYMRTLDPTAPRAIQQARAHRLASSLAKPKVQYDRREDERGTIHQQIPRNLHNIYHRARIADPRGRVFRMYR